MTDPVQAIGFSDRYKIPIMLTRSQHYGRWSRTAWFLTAWSLAASVLYRPAFAQDIKDAPRQISGFVTDAETGLPIPGVQVFYSGTTVGDVSNNEGFYLLPNPPVETIDIVLSMLGYDYVSHHIDLATFDFTSLDFEMKPRVLELGGVIVTDERDKAWEKNLERFKKVFFGKTEFGKSCRLINPEIMTIDFDEKDERLSVSATIPLIVDNQALGYRVTFHDLALENLPSGYRWKSNPQFELLEAKDTGQERKWQKNREKAYRGSLRHLLTSLIRDQLNEEGFEVYDVSESGNYDSQKPIREMSQQNAEKYPPVLPVLLRGVSPGTFYFRILESLMVVYLKEGEPRSYPTAGRGIFSSSDRQQTSWIELTVSIVELDANGNLLFGGSGYPIRTFGYLAWERVGELLPFDYNPGMNE